jgi:lipoate synthase
VLENAKHIAGDEVATKSGLMVGLGESFEEVVDTLGRLRERQVQIITIGQYLRPTERHLPVVRYWHPDEFKALEEAGTRSASTTSPRARSCARATTPTSTCRRTSRRRPACRRAAG